MRTKNWHKIRRILRCNENLHTRWDDKKKTLISKRPRTNRISQIVKGAKVCTYKLLENKIYTRKLWRDYFTVNGSKD